MTSGDHDEVLEAFLDSMPRPNLEARTASWSVSERAEFQSLIDAADLVWEAGHGAPPLDADPVAAMLGLVPDPRIRLDSGALSRSRKKARLKPSDLCERLVSRGWDIEVRDVFRWENQIPSDVGPALINAIAEVLGVGAEQLTVVRGTSPERQDFSAIVNSPSFEGLVNRWARLQGISRSLASSALQSRLLATVHRGDRPNDEQMLRSLDSLIAALEQEQNPRHES